MRRTGYLLVIALVLLCLALYERADWRAQRLLAGETTAIARFERLHQLALASLDSGQRPRLSDLLADPQLSALALIEGLVRPSLAFAWDDVYVYGLAQTTVRPADGQHSRPGYVLRAWPLHFGSSGDIQLHIDSQGRYFQGQNNKGRSGVSGDFPPPFPAPAVGSRRAGWWPAKLAAH